MEKNIYFPSIVFFGTPAFACASLKKLCESKFVIQAVVTRHDHIFSKGVVEQSEIKKFAIEKNFLIFQHTIAC